MLGKAPYVTDNPFRQLALPSSLPHRSLSKQAQTADKKRQVGIEHPAALQADFGGLNDETNPVISRMAANPSERILFRIFWPLTEKGVEMIDVGGTLQPGDLDESNLRHLEFLDTWIGFLRSNASQDLEGALATWDQLQSLPFADKLAEVEAEDDRLELAEAGKRVREVFPRATEVLLTQAVMQARDLWRASNKPESLALLRIVLMSPLDDTAEARALAPMIEIGDSIAKEMDGSERLVEHLRQDLRGLCQVIGGRHPAVDRWQRLLKAYGLHFDQVSQTAPPVVAAPVRTPFSLKQKVIGICCILFCAGMCIIPFQFPEAVYNIYTLGNGSDSSEPEEKPGLNMTPGFDPSPVYPPEHFAERRKLTKEADLLEKEAKAMLAKLDAEDKALAKEHFALETKPNRRNGSAVRTYNRRVTAYNARLKKYKSLQSTYNKKVDVLNKKFTDLNLKGGVLR